MEANIGKALDNGQRVRIDLKRKRATRRATYFTEASRPEFPLLPASDKPTKRRKSKGCENKATKTGASSFGKSLLKRYLNFKKSGVPQRLMFYQDGEWTDFPEDLVEIVGKDIFAKKTTSEIELDGRSYVLDFMRMFKVDLETGCQKPIAWIDEAGKCFFPETFSTGEGYGLHWNCTNEGGEPDFAESCGSHDIKLQLEIEISGLHSSMLNECIGESSPVVLMTPNEQKPSRNQCVMDAEDSCNREPDIKIDEALEVNIETEARSLCSNWKLDYSLVRDMFLKGMKSFTSPDIIDIYPCKGNILQSRRELFEKQAEITSKCRGSANVQYAWLASSKDALSALMTHGLGYVGSSVSEYGIGIQLAASGFPSISAKYCDGDENGILYMVLCRVIMGRTEVLPYGSNQSFPSSNCFDSGVDDLQNPRHYVVWNMNMNTHVFPEAVVSFKASSSIEECKHGASGVTSSSPQAREIESPALHKGSNLKPNLDSGRAQLNAASLESGSQRIPKSPWMPFPMLFEAISRKVSLESMEMVNKHYELFRARTVTREDFINKLRVVVGDTLLRATISELHSKGQNNCNGAAIKPKVEGSG